MKALIPLSAALVLLGGAGAVLAQDVPASDEPTRVEDIVVTGQTAREAAIAFVDSVAATPRGARLARWDGPVCVGVVGLPTEAAQPLIDRVGDLSEQVGLGRAADGCSPTVLVVFTDDGAAMADAWVARDRERFRMGLGNSDMGLAQLARFRTSDAPVRWWHTSVAVNVDSGAMAVRYRGGPPPGGGIGKGAASLMAVRNASRLRSSTRHELNSATIIVDVSRIEGLAWSALIDHVAFLAMAQADPGATFTPGTSILGLFADAQPATSLTDLDLAYLAGLYAGRPDRATARAQEAEVVTGMVREHLGQGRDAEDGPDED